MTEKDFGTPPPQTGHKTPHSQPNSQVEDAADSTGLPPSNAPVEGVSDSAGDRSFDAASLAQSQAPVEGALVNRDKGDLADLDNDAGDGVSRWSFARAKDVVHAYVMLTKPQIIELLLVATVPAMVVAKRGIPDFSTILLTLVAGTLGAASANGFNSTWEAESDKKMNRTKRRPMPNAKIPKQHAFIFIVVLMVLSFIIASVWINLLTAMLILFANLFYVVVYTMYLKKRTSQNIVIGGIAGCIPVLAGWSAVRGQLDLTAWLMFAVLFLWTPPHTWALALKYRDDYAKADIPMLPVVVSIVGTASQILGYTLIMVAFSVLMGLSTYAGWLYFAAAAVLGGGFIWQTFKLYLMARKDFAATGDSYLITPELGSQGMRVFGYSIAYLGLIYIALAVDVALRFEPIPT